MNKDKIIKTFTKIIESKDISKMDRSLYEHLTCNIGLSSHNNIDGFKHHFSGNNFDKFIRLFQSFSIFCIGEHAELNRQFLNITISRYGEYQV